MARTSARGRPDRHTPAVDVDWESPRWREGDDVQGDVEQSRRLKGDRAPAQRGAIDDRQSIDIDPADGREPPSSRSE